MAYASGYKLFPFVIEEASDEEEIEGRPEITLSQLFKWVYRVKKWDVRFKVNGIVRSSVSLPDREVKVEEVFDLDQTSEAASFTPDNERYLLENRYPGFYSVNFPEISTYDSKSEASEPESEDDPLFGADVNYSCYYVMPAPVSFFLYGTKTYNGSHYPNFSVGGHLINFTVGFTQYKQVGSSINSYLYQETVTNTNKDDPSAEEVLVKVIVDGVEFDAYIYIKKEILESGTSILPYSILSTPPSVEIEFTPAEYWPYDPGDTDTYPGKDGSGPVYDTVTGERLRNPFNIVKRGDGSFYNPNYTPP